MLDLKIFYSSEIKNIKDLSKALSDVYKDFLNIKKVGKLNLPKEAYNINRKQYNAEELLDTLPDDKNKALLLWIIHKDIFASRMNFIFGLAKYLDKAVVSTYRLTSEKMIAKESIHEVGHMTGLSHCDNDCVMQFSNSLREAKKKPAVLCNKCKVKLNKNLRNNNT